VLPLKFLLAHYSTQLNGSALWTDVTLQYFFSRRRNTKVMEVIYTNTDICSCRPHTKHGFIMDMTLICHSEHS
jgi:hypothetical protein